MAVMTIEIMKPNVLVVEGREEELIFEAIVTHLELENIQILPIGGKERLRQNLKALVLSPRFTEVISMGIVRDANENPGATFQSVRDALQAVNLPAPERPLAPIGHSPRVTVMILPEEGTPGMLEDLFLRAVAQDPPCCVWSNTFDVWNCKVSPCPATYLKGEFKSFWLQDRKQENG